NRTSCVGSYLGPSGLIEFTTLLTTSVRSERLLRGNQSARVLLLRACPKRLRTLAPRTAKLVRCRERQLQLVGVRGQAADTALGRQATDSIPQRRATESRCHLDRRRAGARDRVEARGTLGERSKGLVPAELRGRHSECSIRPRIRATRRVAA